MHLLLPERVVPKCATDRWFTIALRLEDVFQVERRACSRRTTPTRPIEELLRQGTFPTVQSARSGLIDAVVPDGGGGDRRKKGAADA